MKNQGNTLPSFLTVGKGAAHWVLVAMIAAASPTSTRADDETSSGDKLRILYSNRFHFGEDDEPRVTIAIASTAQSVSLSSKRSLAVHPDGHGASKISAGRRWTVRVREPRAGQIREWTVVARVAPHDVKALVAATATWQKRGFEPESFELGTIFAVNGRTLDSREILVAIAPQAKGGGGAQAVAISRRYGVATSVHRELFQRPQGIIVASSGETVIENPSVLWFAPDNDSDTIEVDQVVFGGGGSQLTTGVENRSYFGSVYVTVANDGSLVVANSVSATQLLAGLVPSEMYADAPMQALRAQAIAARTELLSMIGNRHHGDPFLLCASQHCQVYSGAGKENPRTTAAVRATRGQVLITHDQKIADTRYSAACGGHTEHNEHVWPGMADATLRGQLDGPADGRFSRGVTETNAESFLNRTVDGSFCANTPYSPGRHRWTQTISSERIDALVKARFPNVGHVVGLSSLTRGISGRIVRLGLQGTHADAVVHGELAIRRILGGLRSSLFIHRALMTDGEVTAFEFRGAGFGHGVGMCQLGAIGMANAGRSAREILAHYYRRTRIQQLY